MNFMIAEFFRRRSRKSSPIAGLDMDSGFVDEFHIERSANLANRFVSSWPFLSKIDWLCQRF
jgi:hypothetical protein